MDLYLIPQRYYYQMWLLLLSVSRDHNERACTSTRTLSIQCAGLLTNASTPQPLLSISCGNHVSTRRRIYGSELIQRQLNQQWQLHFPQHKQATEQINKSECECITRTRSNLGGLDLNKTTQPLKREISVNQEGKNNKILLKSTGNAHDKHQIEIIHHLCWRN